MNDNASDPYGVAFLVLGIEKVRNSRIVLVHAVENNYNGLVASLVPHGDGCNNSDALATSSHDVRA